METIKSRSAEETRQLGRTIGESIKPGDVLALNGPLGAGKTVFAQGLAESIGITEPVTSPTFVLICEYRGTMPFYHMDLYRIGSAEEFNWLGVEEMLNGGGVCLIEWSERAENELPDRTIQIEIGLQEDGERIIRIDRPD